ncbi:MAG: DUF1579 domain-containing protein [candidate division Zixibacteria bacterium]|nr:DUF1579 domain-containing protein [candidate division Zixibacteria bacterium]
MRKVLSAMLTAIFLAAVTLLWAQEQQPQQGGAPPKPKFGPELAKLSFLVGNFTTENMTHDSPMGKGGPGKGRNMNRWGLDSLFVMANYEGTMAGMGDYKGHGMFTYDGQAQQYKCWWFDNFGNHSEYTGSFVGDTLAMESEIPTPQGNVKERIMWHPEGKKVKFQMTWDMGQGPVPMMEETATPSGATGGKKK